MTEAQARKLGYEIGRGSYFGTTDDRIDRWYIQEIDSTVVDRRGPGFATKKAALESLEEFEIPNRLANEVDDRLAKEGEWR